MLKNIKTYSLSAVVLPAAIHSLQEGEVVQRLCELHVKEKNLLLLNGNMWQQLCKSTFLEQKALLFTYKH